MKTIIIAALLTLGMSQTTFGKDDPKAVKKISNWVASHIAYPESALENKEEGTVYVAFEIVDGKINMIQVVEGVSSTLDTEAIKVVESIPASELESAQEGSKTYILPINFEIK